MTFDIINPATGERIESFEEMPAAEVDDILDRCVAAQREWRETPVAERARLMMKAHDVLLANKEAYARVMTREMGKVWPQGLAEVEKCAWACEYYAQNGERFLAPEEVETEAHHSFVNFQPLGVVLAVMPWNFPLWQVFRFAAPALMAGNGAVLKHAPNTFGCALLIEEIFREAGFPEHLFRSLIIDVPQTTRVIHDPRVAAVSITSSVAAGRAVATEAGKVLKKCVLELGGSDPFIVLEDADLEATVAGAVASRYLNCGQSCIAAKRFIVVEAIAEAFLERFKTAVEALKVGDPLDPATDIAPMARPDLRDELHQQVLTSLEQGAVALTGCAPIDGPGAYYAPSILDRVEPGMLAYSEELFGPVAIVIRARDAADAIAIANDSPFGLGGSIWCGDSGRGEELARQVESGAVFVNEFVKSDPRLPFGGIKNSGYGRELCHHGMLEFVNAKTIWIR